MTVEPGSREWTNYTGNSDDYPVWHDYHYRQRITDPAILRYQNVDPAYGGGGGGGYYSPETIRVGNLPPGSRASQKAKNEWEPGYGGRREDIEVWEPGYGGRREEKIPSVGGRTTLISPSGIFFDAPTSQALHILGEGGMVAPYTPSRDRDVIWYSADELLRAQKNQHDPGVPSIRGHTTYIDPQGDFFDALTSRHEEIRMSGGKVAPPRPGIELEEGYGTPVPQTSPTPIKSIFSGEFMYSEKLDPLADLHLIPKAQWQSEAPLRLEARKDYFERAIRPGINPEKYKVTPSADYFSYSREKIGILTPMTDNIAGTNKNIQSIIPSPVVEFGSEAYRRSLILWKELETASPPVLKPAVWVGKNTYEFGAGMIAGAYEQPLMIPLSFGAGKVTSVAFKGLSGAVPVLRKPLLVAGGGLTVIYGADVTLRAIQSKSPVGTLGKISSTEVLPFLAGATIKIPTPRLTFEKTRTPRAVPGMGVYVETQITPKLTFGKTGKTIPIEVPSKLDFLQRRALEIQKIKSASRLTEAQKIMQLENENLLLARKSAKIASGKTQKQYLTEATIKTEYNNKKQMQSFMQEQRTSFPQIVVQAAQHVASPVQAPAQAQGEMFASPKIKGILMPKNAAVPVLFAPLRVSQASVTHTKLGLRNMNAVQGVVVQQQAARSIQINAQRMMLSGAAALASHVAIKTFQIQPQAIRQLEKTIALQIPKPALRIPQHIPTTHPPQIKFPNFAEMGGPRRTKGRKVSSYTIKNPLSGLKELIGDLPTPKKGRKQWWEKL